MEYLVRQTWILVGLHVKQFPTSERNDLLQVADPELPAVQHQLLLQRTDGLDQTGKEVGPTFQIDDAVLDKDVGGLESCKHILDTKEEQDYVSESTRERGTG